ncbi:MAG: hypothetical protein ACKVOW_13925 [Chitinophagaceae bacterium]
MDDPTVEDVNNKIKKLNKENDLKLSIELSPKNALENSLLSFIKDIPFHWQGATSHNCCFSMHEVKRISYLPFSIFIKKTYD